MRAEVERDLLDSMCALREKIWPFVGPHVGGGEMVPVETTRDSGMRRDLDVQAGIDFWQKLPEGGLRAWANRVQSVLCLKGQRPTFTIRLSRRSGNTTELEKRRREIEECERGRVCSYFWIHSYMRDRHFTDLVEAGVVRTKHLIDYVLNRGVGSFYRIPNYDGGSSFIAPKWDELMAAGVEVRIIRKQMGLMY